MIKVMKLVQFKDSVMYRFGCDCMDKNHDAMVVLEKDNRADKLWNLTFYKNVHFSAFNHDGFISHWKNRIKAALKILFFGYLEMEEDFIISGEEHINSFISALQDAKKEMGD